MKTTRVPASVGVTDDLQVHLTFTAGFGDLFKHFSGKYFQVQRLRRKWQRDAQAPPRKFKQVVGQRFDLSCAPKYRTSPFSAFRAPLQLGVGTKDDCREWTSNIVTKHCHKEVIGSVDFGHEVKQGLGKRLVDRFVETRHIVDVVRCDVMV